MHVLFCLIALGAAPPSGFLRELPGSGRVDLEINCFALSADGKTAVGGGQMSLDMPNRHWGEVRRWDLATGKELRAWKDAGKNVKSLDLSADGKRIHAILDGPKLAGWGADDARVTTITDLGRISSVRLSLVGKGKSLAILTKSGAAFVDPFTGKETGRLSLRESLYASGTVSSDGKLYAVTNHQDLDVWDTVAGKRRRSFLDHDGLVNSPSFRADGRWVACISMVQDDEKYQSEARVYDVTDCSLIRSIRLECGLYARHAALSPDGGLLAVLSTHGEYGPGRLLLFRVADGGEMARVEYQDLRRWAIGLTFSADGKTLAVCLERSIKAHRVGGLR